MTKTNTTITLPFEASHRRGTESTGRLQEFSLLNDSFFLGFHSNPKTKNPQYSKTVGFPLFSAK